MENRGGQVSLLENHLFAVIIDSSDDLSFYDIYVGFKMSLLKILWFVLNIWILWM
jgi:hypothetical protein